VVTEDFKKLRAGIVLYIFAHLFVWYHTHRVITE